MTRPVLLCQGFQRAFVDHDSPLFSASASLRRGLCERLLRHARASEWRLVHSYLVLNSVDAAETSTIEGFTPLPAEPYFRQASLSAFRTPGFAAKLNGFADAPIFLASFAGLSAIAATFLDAQAHRLNLSIIGDAIADVAHAEVSESKRLAAIETLARAHDRLVLSSELMSGTPVERIVRRSLTAASGA